MPSYLCTANAACIYNNLGGKKSFGIIVVQANGYLGVIDHSAYTIIIRQFHRLLPRRLWGEGDYRKPPQRENVHRSLASPPPDNLAVFVIFLAIITSYHFFFFFIEKFAFNSINFLQLVLLLERTDLHWNIMVQGHRSCLYVGFFLSIF